MNMSLSDPLTWLGVLVASFLIAGLRWLLRRERPPAQGAPEGEDET
jgi:hypothetical protein